MNNQKKKVYFSALSEIGMPTQISFSLFQVRNFGFGVLIGADSKSDKIFEIIGVFLFEYFVRLYSLSIEELKFSKIYSFLRAICA